MVMQHNAAFEGDHEERTEYERLRARLDEPIHAASLVTGRQHAYAKLQEKVCICSWSAVFMVTWAAVRSANALHALLCTPYRAFDV